jgi:hypothetical protein
MISLTLASAAALLPFGRGLGFFSGVRLRDLTAPRLRVCTGLARAPPPPPAVVAGRRLEGRGRGCGVGVVGSGSSEGRGLRGGTERRPPLRARPQAVMGVGFGFGVGFPSDAVWKELRLPPLPLLGRLGFFGETWTEIMSLLRVAELVDSVLRGLRVGVEGKPTAGDDLTLIGGLEAMSGRELGHVYGVRFGGSAAPGLAHAGV